MSTLQNLSPDSRVWVYQSSREFTAEETKKINELAAEFVNSWSAHGSALMAAGEVVYNRFLILGVDEKQASASGCSIDKSVAFVKKIETDFNTNLLDRMLIAYIDRGAIKTCRLPEVAKLLERSEITENTIIFNNLVSTRKDWEDKWQLRLKDSWIVQGVN